MTSKDSDSSFSLISIKYLLFLLAVISTLPGLLFEKATAQTIDDKVREYVQRLESGDRKTVEDDFHNLVLQHQNHPAVIYLQGRLATNGVEALRHYQNLVDNFPTSEWADDALYKIYQYYYAMGLYRTAELKYQQLKNDYPTSPYVTGKPSVILPKEEEPVPTISTKENQNTISREDSASVNVKNSEIKDAEKPSLPKTVGKYTLQVGAFSTFTNAKKQKTFLEEHGYQVEICNTIRANKNLHLVWLGSFENRESALTVKNEIKMKFNIDSIIIERP